MAEPSSDCAPREPLWGRRVWQRPAWGATGTLLLAWGLSLCSLGPQADAQPVSAGTITTVAGGASEPFADDGGLAILAWLEGPQGLALDAAGGLYITEGGCVRRVDAATGVIRTVAGGGSRGSGDGGPALAARLSNPEGLVLDAQGNLYIADGAWVRRVDAATGVITTVAGNGYGGYPWDGVPALRSGVYATDVALDVRGDLYIADGIDHRIRRVDLETGIITTVAGNGTQGFAGDGGLAVDASLNFPRCIAFAATGDLFISDSGNHRIRRVNARTGEITTLAGNGGTEVAGDGGPAVSAGLPSPFGLALDSQGNLFVAEGLQERVRRVDAASGLITTEAGDGTGGFAGDGGPATEARLHFPYDVAVDRLGNLYIADGGNQRVRCVAAGVVSVVGPQPDSGTPGALALRQNSPNPFNTQTTIGYELDAPASVTLTVFDLLGRPVRTLAQGQQGAGLHSFVWDGRNAHGWPVATGVYAYQLAAGRQRLVRRMLLLR